MTDPTAPEPPRAFPERPADVDVDVTAAELLESYQRYLVVLVAARRHADAVPARRRVRHALAALAVAEVIVDDLRAERWPIVVDALRGGATAAQVGAAMAGLDAQEVRVGLTAWAHRLRHTRALTDADHAAVVALVPPDPG